MATIKSEYYRFNGVSWDIHYFKTTMDMVEGLTSALAGKLDKSGGTLTGDLFVDVIKKGSMDTSLTGTGSMMIHPAFNGMGYLIDRGGSIDCTIDGYPLILTTADQKVLVDGSYSTSLRFNATGGMNTNYSASTAYVVGNVCRFDPDGGTNYYIYYCIAPTLGNAPTNTTYWTRIDLLPGVTFTQVRGSGPYLTFTASTVVELTVNLLSTSGYECGIGIMFRTGSQYSRGLKIETFNSTWLTLTGGNLTDNTRQQYWVYNAGAHNTFNKIRYTLSNWASPTWAAVTQLVYSGVSIGNFEQVALVKGGGNMYGNVNWLIGEPQIAGQSLLKINDVYSYVKDGKAIARAGDVNDIITTGFYQGSNMTNAPTTGWYFYIVNRYSSDTNWISQMAVSFGSGNTGNRTYTRSKISGVWSSWVELHNTTNLPLALTNSYQQLEMGGTTQYIRLAYAGNTQAFIKHGADATEEELWHSGNFNPSDYMPKSGGTFTGPVSFTGLTSFEILHIDTMYVNDITSDGGSISFGGVDNINFGYIDLVGIRGLYSETDAFQLSDENIPTLRCGPTGTGTFEVYGSIWTDGDITSKSRKVVTEGPTAAKTANYTFVLGDANGFIYSNSASALTFTIPLNSSVEYPTGTEIHIMRYGTGEISISPTSGVTLVSEGSKRRINAQYQAASLKKLDTNTWVLIGALKS